MYFICLDVLTLEYFDVIYVECGINLAVYGSSEIVYSQAQIGKKEIGGMLEIVKGKQGSSDPKDECGRNDMESLSLPV